MKRSIPFMLLLAGCLQGEAEPPTPTPEPPAVAPAPQLGDLVPSIAVRARTLTNQVLVAQPFDVHGIARIDFELQWPSAVANGAPHEQRIDIFAPDGSLYRTLRGPLGASALAAAGLPIAGSNISRYALVGAWRATVRLDGNTVPVAETGFQLR